MEEKGIRLQKFLAERGIASRRRAADMIRAGRLSVNGRLIGEPGVRVHPARDVIALDGRALPPSVARQRTILLYKPRGYVCSASATTGRTVYELIQAVRERLVPVGRLDKNSEGLLLMSNDGALVHRLTHPRFEQEKTYQVTVSGVVDDDVILRLGSRMLIDGYRIQPARVRILRGGTIPGRILLEFVLKEGRKRQIRRMCEQARLEIHRLARVGIRNLTLKGLRPGEWRDLTAGEVKRLMPLSAAALVERGLSKPTAE